MESSFSCSSIAASLGGLCVPEMVHIGACPLMGSVSHCAAAIVLWVSSPQRDVAYTLRQQLMWSIRPGCKNREKLSRAVSRRMTSLGGMVSPQASKMDRVQLSKNWKESVKISPLAS